MSPCLLTARYNGFETSKSLSMAESHLRVDLSSMMYVPYIIETSRECNNSHSANIVEEGSDSKAVLETYILLLSPI